MWAIEYVQVPIAKEKSDVDPLEELSGQDERSVAAGSVCGISGEPPLIKSDSNCSLASEEASIKEEDSLKEDLDDDESPTKVRMALNVALQQKRPSLVSAKSLHEQINNIVGRGKGELGDASNVGRGN